MDPVEDIRGYRSLQEVCAGTDIARDARGPSHQVAWQGGLYLGAFTMVQRLFTALLFQMLPSLMPSV